MGVIWSKMSRMAHYNPKLFIFTLDGKIVKMCR